MLFAHVNCSGFWTGDLIYSDSSVINYQAYHGKEGCHVIQQNTTQGVEYCDLQPLYENHCPLLNRLAKIPVLNIASGLIRAVVAIIHIIAHLIAAIIYRDKDHATHMEKGGYEFVRGLIEAVPIVGNIYAWTQDPAFLFNCINYLSHPLPDNNAEERIPCAQEAFYANYHYVGFVIFSGEISNNPTYTALMYKDQLNEINTDVTIVNA